MLKGEIMTEIVKIVYRDNATIENVFVDDLKTIKPTILIVYGELVFETDDRYFVQSFYNSEVDGWFSPKNTVHIVLKETIISIKKLKEGIIKICEWCGHKNINPEEYGRLAGNIMAYYCKNCRIPMRGEDD